MYALLAAALAASLHPSAGHAAPEAAAPKVAAPEAIAPEAAAPEAAAASSPVLESAIPWWEKVTVTVDNKGEKKCLYEASYSGKGAEACDKDLAESIPAGKSDQAGLYSKLTFERRFSPGAVRLDSGKLQPGDTLIGRQVMFLTLGADGSIASCHVVATSGEAPSDYDCDEVKKEQFKAQASADAGARQAFMTVLAYGHTEQIA